MTYPKAYAGVKKVYNSEILSLIGTILIGPGAIVMAVGAGAAGAGAALAAVGGICMIVGLVLNIISYIMKLVGLSQASKDEQKCFKAAFALSIVALIFTIVSGGVSVLGGSTASTVVQAISTILEILIAVNVISGIMDLADRFHNEVIREKGKNILVIWVVIYVIALILQLVNVQALTAILGIVSLILMIIVYILYLSYLSKAVKMLQN